MDLPWQGNAVYIEISTRKFFCDNAMCARRIFTEPLPQVAERYARKTVRLDEALRELAFLAGGEAAARIARAFGLLVSPDSLIASIKKTPLLPVQQMPRVLGVDDFAFKKGRRYGTILVDLERRRPLDLLPDREASTVEAWLKAHPGIEVVSRDRAKCYAEGIRAGAPQATQVTDRWHLFKNIGDVLEKLLLRKHRLLKEIAVRDDPRLHQSPPPAAALRKAKQMEQRRERRLAQYQQIVALHRRGTSILGIQRLTGADPKTIRKYLKSGEAPERQKRRRSGPHLLTEFHTYLEQRWSEGCHNAVQLLAEIRASGYCGGYTTLRDFIQPMRVKVAMPPVLTAPGAKRLSTSPPTPRRLAWLITNQDNLRVRAEEAAFQDKVTSVCPEVRHAAELAQQLCTMIRERRADELDIWLAAAQQSEVAEIKTLGRSLQADRAAVAAALSCEWSNGQVEGQVNRLKFVKRSMYGRGSFDLLRARVLHRAADNVA